MGQYTKLNLKHTSIFKLSNYFTVLIGLSKPSVGLSSWQGQVQHIV